MFEHRGSTKWAAVVSIAGKIGSTQTLLNWVRQHEHDTGQRAGLSIAEAKQINELERENRQLHRANEILKLASAFCACSQTTGPEGSRQGRTASGSAPQKPARPKINTRALRHAESS